MDLKRYFRGPFVAVLVILLLFFFVYRYASSGTSYKPVDTSQVVTAHRRTARSSRRC